MTNLATRLDAQAAALRKQDMAFAQIGGEVCLVDRSTRLASGLSIIEPITFAQVAAEAGLETEGHLVALDGWESKGGVGKQQARRWWRRRLNR